MLALKYKQRGSGDGKLPEIHIPGRQGRVNGSVLYTPYKGVVVLMHEKRGHDHTHQPGEAFSHTTKRTLYFIASKRYSIERARKKIEQRGVSLERIS